MLTRNYMDSRMKPTSVRLTDAELAALQQAAALHNTTVGALLRKAALALANKLGAPERKDKAGTVPVTVNLYPADMAALTAYMNATEMTSRSDATRAALRVGLIKRGLLTMEPGVQPDNMEDPMHR